TTPPHDVTLAAAAPPGVSATEPRRLELEAGPLTSREPAVPAAPVSQRESTEPTRSAAGGVAAAPDRTPVLLHPGELVLVGAAARLPPEAATALRTAGAVPPSPEARDVVHRDVTGRDAMHPEVTDGAQETIAAATGPPVVLAQTLATAAVPGTAAAPPSAPPT